MQIDIKSKISDVQALLDVMDERSVSELKRAAVDLYGSPWGITIGQLFGCMGSESAGYTDADFSLIGMDLQKPEEMIVAQYYWVQAFRDMVESLIRALENMTVPPTPEAAKANRSCLSMSFRESILVFCRSYFGLHSFSAVEDLTIDDLLLAKKDAYNTAVFEKEMAAIHEAKTKRK